MEQLWAPWRMAYIRREQPAGDAGCFLCSYAERRDDDVTYVLARSTLTFAVLNLFPYNPGHLMIAPYAHVATIEDLEPAALSDMMVLAQRMLAALRGAMQPDGFNMGINQGKVAGAGVADHVHFHVVPRWNGDTNFMAVLGDVRVIPDLLSNTYSQLRARLEPQSAASGLVEQVKVVAPAKPSAKTARRPRTRGKGSE